MKFTFSQETNVYFVNVSISYQNKCALFTNVTGTQIVLHSLGNPCDVIELKILEYKLSRISHSLLLQMNLLTSLCFTISISLI